MKALGLNPAEQETIDMTNEVGSNGLVYFPDFCKIVLRKYREDDRELLNQALFKVIFLNVMNVNGGHVSRQFVAPIPTQQTSEPKSGRLRKSSSQRMTSSS